LTAELFNSTVEIIYRGLDEVTKRAFAIASTLPRGRLLASITAAIIGGSSFSQADGYARPLVCINS